MARWCSRILLLVILAVSNAPLVILVQFHLDRSRIARELCVQRDLVENTLLAAYLRGGQDEQAKALLDYMKQLRSSQ